MAFRQIWNAKDARSTSESSPSSRIWTFDSKGEVLLTIMSSLAQEESRSISENVTWGWRKRFEDGKVSVAYSHFLGYDKGENGTLVINKEQAEIVNPSFRNSKNVKYYLRPYCLRFSEAIFDNSSHCKKLTFREMIQYTERFLRYREVFHCSEWHFRVYAFIWYFYSAGIHNIRSI